MYRLRRPTPTFHPGPNKPLPMKPRLLFVDDDPLLLKGLRRALSFKCDEWDKLFANSGREALALMEKNPFDVVISDLHMPGMNGVELLNQVRLYHPQSTRFVLSGKLGDSLTPASLEAAQLFFCKPCDPDLLVSSVAAVLENRFRLQGVFEVASE